MQILQEPFEAWLFSQKPDRIFDYYQGYVGDDVGCLVCNFLRETQSRKHTRVGVSTYSFGPMADQDNDFPFPNWLQKLIPFGNVPNKFTAGLMQDRYISLFGDPRLKAEPVQNESTKPELQPA